jgi:ribosomal protein S12 methylthiotransferase
VLSTCAACAACCQAIVEAAGLNADGKRRQVVVTGCLAQRYGPSLAADLPEADLVMGFQAYSGLPGELAQRLGVATSSSSSDTSSSRVQVWSTPLSKAAGASSAGSAGPV